MHDLHFIPRGSYHTITIAHLKRKFTYILYHIYFNTTVEPFLTTTPFIRPPHFYNNLLLTQT